MIRSINKGGKIKLNWNRININSMLKTYQFKCINVSCGMWPMAIGHLIQSPIRIVCSMILIDMLFPLSNVKINGQMDYGRTMNEQKWWNKFHWVICVWQQIDSLIEITGPCSFASYLGISISIISTLLLLSAVKLCLWWTKTNRKKNCRFTECRDWLNCIEIC